MARLASREHLARGDVQGGEQVKRAVANVIVRPSFGLPDVHRQDRLRTLERLDLGFLVEREYGGIRRRIHIEPHDVAHFLDQLRVRRDLERLSHLRLQTKRAPDPADGRMAHPGVRRHGPSTPVRGAGRRRFERVHDHRFDLLIRDGARRSDPRRVVDAVEAPVNEALAPFANGRIGGAIASRDRRIRRAVGARQHEPRADASNRFARGRFVNRIKALRSSAVRDNSGMGRPVIGMPL
jgi:hypothetical protein